jgi:FixJ family two-component response regulator
MPGMSGLELQNILKVKAPRLPVIFLTAFPNDRGKGVSMSQGAFYYLEKPCPADELCACVAEAIGRRDPES